jgi:hypothetical protein
MSYILEPVNVEIDKEVEAALYEEHIEVGGISIIHKGSRECRRVALKLTYDQPHGEELINSNYEKLKEHLQRACNELVKKDPVKYKDIFRRLLLVPAKEGIFKEFIDPDLAETLI